MLGAHSLQPMMKQRTVPDFLQQTHRGLLDLFLLEKALYEVRYELQNRPDWVVIPLRGILSLLQPTV